MTIRPATDADLPELGRLYREFLREVPPPEYEEVSVDQELTEVADMVRGDDVALVAEDDGAIQGFALGRLRQSRVGFLTDVYVAPDVRRRGVGRRLVAEVGSVLSDQGAQMLELDVQPWNTAARRVYDRMGFAAKQVRLVAPIDELAARVAPSGTPQSFGSTHVQTDDEVSVNRAIQQFLTRLGHSLRTDLTPARHGWIAIYDELCDRDRVAHRRFGTELSERLGVPVVALRLEEGAVVRYLLFERGRMVDEYLSVPTYYGDLNKADELSLAANPTLASRLTGADPAEVRAVVRTASSLAELPPGPELLQQVAAALGLETTIER